MPRQLKLAETLMTAFSLCHIPSLVPSPTPSFSSLLSTVKRGGPGTFPHVSDVKGRKGYKDRKQAWAYVGLRTARRAKVPGNTPHVSS